jgi:hypothetical protein
LAAELAPTIKRPSLRAENKINLEALLPQFLRNRRELRQRRRVVQAGAVQSFGAHHIRDLPDGDLKFGLVHKFPLVTVDLRSQLTLH